MTDLLLPSTDGGVVVQAVVATTVLGLAMFVVRRDRDLRLLVAGIATMTAAWFGLRALH